MLPLGSRFAVGALDRLDRVLQCSFRSQASGGMSEELDAMQRFEARNVAATLGCHFAVEDLHEAFLLLGADALVVQEHIEDQIQSQTLEQDEAVHCDGQKEDSMPCLDGAELELQDLDSQLQSQRSERIRLRLMASALTEELRKVKGALADCPNKHTSRQQAEAARSDCNQGRRMVSVNGLSPRPRGEPSIKLVHMSEMQPPSRNHDPLGSLQFSSPRHSWSSSEDSIGEADDAKPLSGEESQDLRVAHDQGTDKESHLSESLSVQPREDMAASMREMASMVQRRPAGDSTVASQTGELTVYDDTGLHGSLDTHENTTQQAAHAHVEETAIGSAVPLRLDSKCLAQELQKADKAWAQHMEHVASNSTKGQASVSNSLSTSQPQVAEVWIRVS